MITKNMNALVVDDYDLIRNRLSQILKPLFNAVFEADNGVHALSVLNTEKIDIVFTDIVMPEMDGFELCEEIRKYRKWMNLPVVAISTHYDSKYIVKALRKGADDYLAKPADARMIHKVLERVLTPIELPR